MNDSALNPDDAGESASLYESALRAASEQNFAQALYYLDRLIAIDPSNAMAYYKRGNALKNLGRLPAAVASYDQAISRKRDFAYAHCNRGVVLQAMALNGEALASYDAALVHDPVDAMSHYNRALVLQVLSRWDDAIVSYDRAISIDPTFADAHYNRSLALLYRGELEQGFLGYEWRWKNAARLGMGEARNFARPLWLGEPSLKGKRLLLHSEGGLGDTIHFCRYASLAAAGGATVYLEVQPALRQLLSKLDGVSDVIVKGGVLPDFDYHCPMMSLPLAFRTGLDTIPPTAGPLDLDNTKAARWNSLRAGKQRGPRIGLVWSGGPVDERRRIDLAELAAHLPRGYQYFRLQKDVREEDRAALASSSFINSSNDDVQDFLHIAALCECMDLVISIDTSVAHLSGTLGRPTWLLLHFAADWRWLRDRDVSPWYPSMKLMRQESPGDWTAVLARVAHRLRNEYPVG